MPMEAALGIIKNGKLIELSPSIFGVMEKNSEEINVMVQSCQILKHQEYQMGIAA